MKNCISLPGITKIGYVECNILQSNLALKSAARVPVAIFTEINSIRFFGNPTCEVVEEYDNNGRKVATSLKFVSNDAIPINKHLAFVIEDVSGTSSIIGTKESPYPIIQSSSSKGTPHGESNTTTYEIKWSSICKPIVCAI